MEPTTYGIVSIVPVIVLIVVALITKRTFESLLIATLLAERREQSQIKDVVF